MQVTMTFYLPEERDDLETAQNGSRYRAVLDDLDGWLRQKQKYEGVETVTVEEVRRALREFRDDI